MKKNRIRALTVIIVTALSVAMAGCSEMDNMSRIVRADADIAQQHMDSQKRHQAPLVWTDKPWVNLKPIVQATPSPQKAGLPACNITVGSRDGPPTGACLSWLRFTRSERGIYPWTG